MADVSTIANDYIRETLNESLEVLSRCANALGPLARDGTVRQRQSMLPVYESARSAIARVQAALILLGSGCTI